MYLKSKILKDNRAYITATVYAVYNKTETCYASTVSGLCTFTRRSDAAGKDHRATAHQTDAPFYLIFYCQVFEHTLFCLHSIAYNRAGKELRKTILQS